MPISSALPQTDDVRSPVDSTENGSSRRTGAESAANVLPMIGDRAESSSTACGLLPGDVAAAFKADPSLMPVGRLAGSVTIVAPDGHVVPDRQAGPAPSKPEPNSHPSRYSVPAHLDQIPVTSVQVDVRPLFAATDPKTIATGTSDHAFIIVTRQNGFKQVLAADPVPSNALSGTSQLTFEAGTEDKAEVAHPKHPTDLHAPSYPGLTPEQALTRYGNELVQGAKEYETHPVRYDMLGSQGWNSNGWAGSLIVAKGGEAGRADVAALAAKYDGGQPLLHANATGTPPWKPDADGREVDLIAAASEHHRLIVPGLHNPTIPADRFQAGTPHDAVAQYPPSGNATSLITRGIGDHRDVFESNVKTFINENQNSALEALKHLFTLPSRVAR